MSPLDLRNEEARDGTNERLDGRCHFGSEPEDRHEGDEKGGYGADDESELRLCEVEHA